MECGIELLRNSYFNSLETSSYREERSVTINNTYIQRIRTSVDSVIFKLTGFFPELFLFHMNHQNFGR